MGWRSINDPFYGHSYSDGVMAPCRMMRCYNRSGLGHKAQDCWSTRKQPLRNFLYSSSRKASTDEGTNAERTNAKKQVWMKKASPHLGYNLSTPLSSYAILLSSSHFCEPL